MNNISRKTPNTKKSVTFADLTGPEENLKFHTPHDRYDFHDTQYRKWGDWKDSENNHTYHPDNYVDHQQSHQRNSSSYKDSEQLHEHYSPRSSSSTSPQPVSSRRPLTVELLTKPYPNHGIIRSSPPGWLGLNQLHRNPTSQPHLPKDRQSSFDFRRRRLDLEEDLSLIKSNNEYPTCNSSLCSRPHFPNITTGREFNTGQRTSDLYTVDSSLPVRFNNPDWFQGYGCDKSAHPFYRTTSAEYGLYPPNVHTMPQTYHPVKNIFSEHLKSTGIHRNRSLNI